MNKIVYNVVYNSGVGRMPVHFLQAIFVSSSHNICPYYLLIKPNGQNISSNNHHIIYYNFHFTYMYLYHKTVVTKLIFYIKHNS